ncbi:MAG: hypothetical protein VX768_10520 [Planctomycetota bacterium]|nr:hypothetical protein [Planctomycetota bacterium]
MLVCEDFHPVRPGERTVVASELKVTIFDFGADLGASCFGNKQDGAGLNSLAVERNFPDNSESPIRLPTPCQQQQYDD